MMMVKTVIVMLVLTGSSSAFRQNVKRAVEEVEEANTIESEMNMPGGKSKRGKVEEVDGLEMMSMMAGSVKSQGVNARTGKLSQKLAGGVSSRKGVEGIEVYRASQKSKLVKDLVANSVAHQDLKEQVAFQTKLNFNSASHEFNRQSLELMPLFREEVETEMDAMNDEHGNCKSDGLTTCNFVLCTYIGTTSEFEYDGEPAEVNPDVKTVDAEGRPWASQLVSTLMTARAATIQGELDELKEVDEHLDVNAESVTYGGSTRFAAVIMKVYGATRPPCEKADMNPITAEQGEQIKREVARVQEEIEDEVEVHGGSSRSHAAEDEDEFAWLDPNGGSQTGFHA